jgi:hypothetical protein
VSRLSAADIAERKAQLATRAALERMRMTLALHGVRRAMIPPAPQEPSRLRRPLVALVVGVAAQRYGPARLRRWLRIASVAIAAYRIVKSLRG